MLNMWRSVTTPSMYYNYNNVNNDLGLGGIGVFTPFLVIGDIC